MFQKQLRKNAAGYSATAMKAVSIQYFLVMAVASQLVVFWLSSKGSLFPGEETLQQIIGTCAEVVAGLYGITLAGYTFFLSRIDALTSSDATLDYVVSSVKTRFKYLIWYITVNVAATLIICLVLMYYPVSSEWIPEHIYRLICNEFVLFLVFSVGLILYYSLCVIDPNCIEKEAARLKKKLDLGFGPAGNPSAFISIYDRIENRCFSLLPKNVLQQLQDNKGKHLEHALALLPQNDPRVHPVMADLHRIHRYYECMVNCSTLEVSQPMCLLAENVLRFLEHLP